MLCPVHSRVGPFEGVRSGDLLRSTRGGRRRRHEGPRLCALARAPRLAAKGYLDHMRRTSAVRMRQILATALPTALVLLSKGESLVEIRDAL